MIGDPGQIPPVGDKPLYHSVPTNDIGEQGRFNYFMFDKVVKLNLNHRASGTGKCQEKFRSVLMRLRTGDSTEEDWKELLTRQPSQIKNISQFQDAIRLFIW